MNTLLLSLPARVLVLAAAMLVGLGGCDANEPNGTSGNLSGAYFLQLVSSQANFPDDQNLTLPATIVTQLFGTLHVDSGSITFGSGGTYTVTFQGANDVGSGGVSFTEQGQGTYVRRGDALTFNEMDDPAAIAFTGMVDGSTILLVYKLAGLPYELHMGR
jgi:hypothetical protein